MIILHNKNQLGTFISRLFWANFFPKVRNSILPSPKKFISKREILSRKISVFLSKLSTFSQSWETRNNIVIKLVRWLLKKWKNIFSELVCCSNIDAPCLRTNDFCCMQPWFLKWSKYKRLRAIYFVRATWCHYMQPILWVLNTFVSQGIIRLMVPCGNRVSVCYIKNSQEQN